MTMLFVHGLFAVIQTGCTQCIPVQPAGGAARYLLLTVYLCLLFTRSGAQAPGPYTITRVEEQTVAYLFPDSISSFLKHEQIALLPYSRRDSVVIQVYANSDMRTTIFHQSDSRFEPWITRPHKSIIDKKTVKLYNAAGNIMLNKAHSLEYKTHLTTLKSYLSETDVDIVPDHVPLTNSLKSELLAEGFVMSALGGGTIRFVKDSVQLFYNNGRKMNELRLMHTDGSLKYAIKRDFTVNSFGQTVPAFEQVRYTDARFPDGCVEVLSNTKYPQYYITPGTGREAEPSALLVDAAELSIMPNPASDACTLIFAPVQSDGSISVYNREGQLVLQQELFQSDSEILIDLKDWHSGLYVVRLIADTTTATRTFIKSE